MHTNANSLYKIWVNKGMIELINYCLQLTIYSYQKTRPNQLKNWTNRKKIPNSSYHVWITNSHTCLIRHLNTLTKLHVVLHICTPKLHIVLLDTSFLPLFCSVSLSSSSSLWPLWWLLLCEWSFVLHISEHFDPWQLDTTT